MKIYGGDLAIPGNIIVRQRGTNFHPGIGVGIGKDHTIYAMTEGLVEFKRKKNDRCFVNILPLPGETTPVKKASPKKKAPVEFPVEAPAEKAVVEEAEEKPRKRKKVEPEGE